MGTPGGDETEPMSPERAALERPAAGSLRVSLLLYQRDNAILVPLEVDRAIVVGRHESADVRLEDAGLSRQHARFGVNEDGVVTVEDLGSTNGTWIDGRRVTR